MLLLQHNLLPTQAHAGNRTSLAASFKATKDNSSRINSIRRVDRHSTVAAASAGPSALLLEADGVVCDIHMDGHRQAFNRAFRELGMDCVNWTPSIYHDLLYRGDGTGEGLVDAYYACVGWPTFLPTAEQQAFAGRVHQLKQKHLKLMLQQGAVPLRDGVRQVMLDALAAGTTLAVLTETASQPEDGVITALLDHLPAEVAAAVRVYSTSMYSKTHQHAADSDDSSTELEDAEAGSGSSSSGSSLEAKLAAAATKVKQREAQEFVQRMASALQDKQAGVLVKLTPTLQNLGSASPISPQWLAAVAATLGVPISSCLTVASSNDLVNAASAAGMVAVAIPRKLAYAASYPAAAAKFEGLGAGYATWQKLSSLWVRQQQSK